MEAGGKGCPCWLLDDAGGGCGDDALVMVETVDAAVGGVMVEGTGVFLAAYSNWKASCEPHHCFEGLG